MRPLFLFILLVAPVTCRYTMAFAPHQNSRRLIVALSASVKSNAVTEARRKTLMSREGPYFQLDRMSGKIEFGATAKLVTQLDEEPAQDILHAWLYEERNLAFSIWDPKLIELRNVDWTNSEPSSSPSIYRLQIMTLQFVTLQLAPWVDMQMKTYKARSVKDPSRTMPIFRLQSMDFDPNLQVVPGMRVTAESLGIQIEVVGEMRPTANGGVSGSISFATMGELPPPLRILPESALKAASDSINETVVQFAIKNFQTGAKKNYLEFRERYQRKGQEAMVVQMDGRRDVASS